MLRRSALALASSISALVLAACSGTPSNPDAVGACSDGVDNDGDSLADFPADPGCADAGDSDESNAPIAQCSDTRDNDGDGLIDYPNDPGCLNQLQNSEADDCPGGDSCPLCANGVDDDADGATDYPQDPGCVAASDDDEYVTNPAACGSGLIVTRLLDENVSGTLVSGATSDLMGSCGGVGDEVAYELVLAEPTVIVADTDDPMTTANTVLYLRDDCMQPTTELACSDDIAPGTNAKSRIQVSVPAGIYYLIVDNQNSLTAGDFALHVELFAGEGAACASTVECGPGLVCRVPVGQTEMVCADPVCSDGADDDGDLVSDYPADPGCDGPADGDETDDCPNGANCPACANDLDDDGDGETDYPLDLECGSASQPVEGCGTEQDAIFALTMATMTDDLVGLSDDWNTGCSSTSGHLDRVYFVTVPAMDSITFDTNTSEADTVLALYPSTCAAADEIDCDDDGGSDVGDSLMTLTGLSAGAYALVVSNYGGSFLPGPYVLHTTGVIAPGGRCDGALAGAGVIACGPNYTCNGTICVGSLACNNGVDDDGDGVSDFPDDPGCTSSIDTTETDDCPDGANCPECGNNVDDDGDLLVDYPDDTACTSASSTSESCTSTEAVVELTTPTLAGTTVGQTNDFNPTCAGAASGPDLFYQLDLPATSTITITTEPNSYDAVVTLLGASCGAPAIQCSDDPESITRTNLAAGRYYVDVDGFGTFSSGTFQLGVSGVIVDGGYCELPLVESGALTCAAGFACQGPGGMQTCQPSACNDAVDADGDGFTGYPTDPGCTTISDPTEDDDCPTGPTCPQCSNDADDELDGQTDYPADTGCSAASDPFEACDPETDPITTITTPTTSGTTVGATNNFGNHTCQSQAAPPDVAYLLTVPVALSTLTMDTNGSGLDTILVFDDTSCAAPRIACDDDAGTPNNESLITRTNVAAGNYIIIVDGFGSALGPHQLHVNGVAVAGAACTSPLFAAGVLTCATGETCTAGTCQ